MRQVGCFSAKNKIKLNICLILTTTVDLGSLCCVLVSLDSPGSIKLHQPQAVTLDNLPVEVGGSELNDIITGGVKCLHREEQGADKDPWRRGERNKSFDARNDAKHQPWRKAKWFAN